MPRFKVTRQFTLVVQVPELRCFGVIVPEHTFPKVYDEGRHLEFPSEDSAESFLRRVPDVERYVTRVTP